MDSEYINLILSRLIKLTKDSLVTWMQEKSNTQKILKFFCHNESEDTKFTIELCLDDDLKMFGHGMWHLYIYNNELVDGKISVYSGNEPLVKELAELLNKLYILPIVKKKNQDMVLNKILNSLDLENIRDEKINSILTKRDI